MAKPRGNWKVRDSAERLQPLIDEYKDRHSGDYECSIVDVIADLMHWCYSNRQDFERALQSAYTHATVEQDPYFREGKPRD